MSSRRALKTAEAVREVVSVAVLSELSDPRIRGVTVTYVEVSGDLRHAKVHVSVMGSDSQQELCLRGLQNAAGFLQSRIAHRVELRWTPKLTFVLDQGVKRSIEVAKILRRVLPPEPTAADSVESAETQESADFPESAEAQESAEPLPPDQAEKELLPPPDAEPPNPGR